MIIILLMALTMTQGAHSQGVYKEIMKLSQDVANDESKDLQTRKVATFKVDALVYMAMKMNEVMPDSTVKTLDYEAYAMYDFVNLYIKKLGEAKKKRQRLKWENSSRRHLCRIHASTTWTSTSWRHTSGPKATSRNSRSTPTGQKPWNRQERN